MMEKKIINSRFKWKNMNVYGNVYSVNGKEGDVILSADDIGTYDKPTIDKKITDAVSEVDVDLTDYVKIDSTHATGTPPNLMQSIDIIEDNEVVKIRSFSRDMSGINPDDIVEEFVLPNASNTTAGLESPEDHRQIQYNKELIESLNGQTQFLTSYNFGSSTPSQQELTNYATSLHPEWDNIPNGIFVRNLYDGIEWAYNSYNDTWINYGQGTVSTASNTSLGVVQGVEDDPDTFTQDGKLSVTEIGTMIVNGFLRLKTYVYNIPNSISKIATTLFPVTYITGIPVLSDINTSGFGISPVQSTILAGNNISITQDSVNTSEFTISCQSDDNKEKVFLEFNSNSNGFQVIIDNSNHKDIDIFIYINLNYPYAYISMSLTDPIQKEVVKIKCYNIKTMSVNINYYNSSFTNTFSSIAIGTSKFYDAIMYRGSNTEVIISEYSIYTSTNILFSNRATSIFN